MDADRFDTIARSLRESPSRRGVLRGGVGGLAVSLFGLADAGAKKRRKNKKKNKGKTGCGTCGSDAAGACFCGDLGVCATKGTQFVNDCSECPAGTVHCVGDGAGAFCSAPCGSPFV